MPATDVDPLRLESPLRGFPRHSRRPEWRVGSTTAAGTSIVICFFGQCEAAPWRATATTRRVTGGVVRVTGGEAAADDSRCKTPARRRRSASPRPLPRDTCCQRIVGRDARLVHTTNRVVDWLDWSPAFRLLFAYSSAAVLLGNLAESTPPRTESTRSRGCFLTLQTCGPWPSAPKRKRLERLARRRTFRAATGSTCLMGGRAWSAIPATIGPTGWCGQRSG